MPHRLLNCITQCVVGFILVSLITVFTACGQDKSDSGEQSPATSAEAVEIEVVVQGFNAGFAFLGGVLGDQYFMVDSFAIESNGAVNVNVDRDMPEGMYYLMFPDGQTSLQILLSDSRKFSMETSISDPVANMNVNGSTDNRLLYENLKFEQNYQARYQPVRQQLNSAPEGSTEYAAIRGQLDQMVEERRDHLTYYAENYPESFFTKFKMAGQNPRLQEPLLPDGSVDLERQAFMYRNQYWDNVDFNDGRLLRTPVYVNKLGNYFDRIVPQSVDSLIKYADFVTRKSMANDSLFKFTTNYIGIKYKEPKFMGADAIYVHMVKNFFTEDLAFWSPKHEIDRLQLDADIRDVSMIGRKAQNIEVKDPDNNNISLHDINADYTVLYIYNTQCENCQKETPKVLDFYRQWKNRGVEVFALSTDEDPMMWQSYIRTYQLDWINGIDFDNSSEYTFKYHIDVTPEIYVLNRNKEIIAKDLQAFQIPIVIEQDLGN